MDLLFIAMIKKFAHLKDRRTKFLYKEGKLNKAVALLCQRCSTERIIFDCWTGFIFRSLIEKWCSDLVLSSLFNS